MRLWDGSKILIDRCRLQADYIVAVSHARVEPRNLSLSRAIIIGGSGVVLRLQFFRRKLTGPGVSSSSGGSSLWHALLSIAILDAVAGFPAEEAEACFKATILLFFCKSLAPSAALGATISSFVEIYLSLSRLIGSRTARIPTAALSSGSSTSGKHEAAYYYFLYFIMLNLT